jgi:hypothetical protein
MIFTVKTAAPNVQTVVAPTPAKQSMPAAAGHAPPPTHVEAPPENVSPAKVVKPLPSPKEVVAVPPPATVQSGPVVNTHVYTFIPASKELVDFSSETGSSNRRTIDLDVYSDSSWCIIPGNALSISGGSLGMDKSSLQSISEFHLMSNQTKHLPDMACPRSQHGSIYSGGYVYLLGGNNQHGVGQPSFERLDIAT